MYCDVLREAVLFESGTAAVVMMMGNKGRSVVSCGLGIGAGCEDDSVEAPVELVMVVVVVVLAAVALVALVCCDGGSGGGGGVVMTVLKSIVVDEEAVVVAVVGGVLSWVEDCNGAGGVVVKGVAMEKQMGLHPAVIQYSVSCSPD